MTKKSPPTTAGTLENSLAAVQQLLAENADRPLKPSDKTQNVLEQNLLFTIDRHRASLDWLIDSRAKGKIRPRTRRILWWALAEILYLDGAQPHHVVNVAVSFVRKHHAAPEAGFVNAFLRRLLADSQDQPRQLLASAPAHVQLELPSVLWQRWCQTYGEDQTRELAQAMLQPAPIICRLTRGAQAPEHRALQPFPAPDWAPDSTLFTWERTALAHGELGSLMRQYPQLYIQDPATLLAPTLLNPAPGETVADLCAAPGGKAKLLAEALQHQGKLICRDRAPDKISRLLANLGAQPGLVLDCAAGDATHPDLPPASCQAVLIDVPCSNTGVFRRKPDAKWTFSERKLQELVQLQADILRGAASLVAPSGRLVYSTCSIEPEENLHQVERFLQQHPDFSCVQHRQLLPGAEHDGAFAALLLRNASV